MMILLQYRPRTNALIVRVANIIIEKFNGAILYSSCPGGLDPPELPRKVKLPERNHCGGCPRPQGPVAGLGQPYCCRTCRVLPPDWYAAHLAALLTFSLSLIIFESLILMLWTCSHHAIITACHWESLPE